MIEGRKHYIMKSIIILTFRWTLYDQINEYEFGCLWSTHGWDERGAYSILAKKSDCRRPVWGCILNQFNPIHTPTLCLFNVTLNIIFPAFPSYLFPPGFLYARLISPSECHTCRIRQLSNKCWRVRIIRLLGVYFSFVSWRIPWCRLKYSPQHHCLKL